MIGNPSFNSALWDKGISLDGVDDYLEIPHDSAIDARRVITHSLWFKANSLNTAWTPLIFKGGNESNTTSRTYTTWLSQEFFAHAVTNDQFGRTGLETELNSWSFNQWHSLVSVMDRNTGIYRLYLDGTLQAESSIRQEDAISTTSPLRIGWTHESDAANSYFHGIIDELRIYDRALSTEEVLSLYRYDLGLTHDLALDGRVPFDANASGISPATDRSGYLGQALAVDADGDTLVMQDLQAPDKWSLSFWIKPELDADSNQSRFSLTPELELTLALDANGTHLEISLDDQNLSTESLHSNLISLASLEDNNGWLHLSLSRQLGGVGGAGSTLTGGYYHTLFLKDDGSLWGMGRNSYGELGNDNSNHQRTPIQIIDSAFLKLRWFLHTLFLKDDGSLWGMGYNLMANSEMITQ